MRLRWTSIHGCVLGEVGRESLRLIRCRRRGAQGSCLPLSSLHDLTEKITGPVTDGGWRSLWDSTMRLMIDAPSGRYIVDAELVLQVPDSHLVSDIVSWTATKAGRDSYSCSRRCWLSEIALAFS